LNTNDKSRNAWIFAGCALAALYFAPSLIKSIERAHQPKAAPVAAPMAKPVVKTGPIIPPAVAALVGKWQGSAPVSDRGNCNLKFELRDKPEMLGHYSGYSTLTCVALESYAAHPEGTRRALGLFTAVIPTSAILAGTLKDSSIQFRVDQTFGTICPPTSLSITPFGNDQMAAAWKDPCGDGQMVLSRSRQ